MWATSDMTEPYLPLSFNLTKLQLQNNNSPIVYNNQSQT